MPFQEYSLDMNDLQMKAFANSLDQVKAKLSSGEINDSTAMGKALQSEIDRTFPPGYPTPIVSVYIDSKTTVQGDYNLGTNELRLNLAVPSLQAGSSKKLSNTEKASIIIREMSPIIIHEREHAIQAKKVSDYIATDLIAKGIPLTPENIVEASKASAIVGEVDNNNNPVLDVSGKQNQVTSTVFVSLAVAKQSVKEFENNKRLNQSQVDEAKQLIQDDYSSNGILKREGLRLSAFSAQRNARADKLSLDTAQANYIKANKAPKAPKDKIEELRKIWDAAKTKLEKSVSAYDLILAKYKTAFLSEAQAYAAEEKFVEVSGLKSQMSNVNQSYTGINEFTIWRKSIDSSVITTQGTNRNANDNSLQAQSEQVYIKTLSMVPKDLTLTDDQRVAKALIAANFDASTVAAVIENGSPKTKTMDESAKGDYAQGIAKAAEVNKEAEVSKVASASKSADQGIQV
jgi:hypothetical protein